MIELRVKDYCSKCLFFKPIVLERYNDYTKTPTIVVCKRWEMCGSAVAGAKLSKLDATTVWNDPDLKK